MSYCRWSSDDWKSDLYVYADVSGGWTIHVAGSKVVGEVPPEDWAAMKRGDTEAWVASHKRAMGYLDTAERKPIGLPCDGETFHTAGPAECADKIEELVAMGYHCPAGVVEELRAEAEEEEGK